MPGRTRFLKSLWPGIIIFAFLAASLCYFHFSNKPGLLRVHFMDVGYGDAVLIELPDKTALLIDSGEARYSDRVITYLNVRGIKEIDTAILTHPHDNHFGGFADIMDRFPVGRFYLNGDEKNAEEGYSALLGKIKEQAIPAAILRRGDEIRSKTGNTGIKILHPADISGSANQNSIVTRLAFGRTSFLFTSDIKKPQQKQIMELYPEIQSADCIQVPHHGGEISRKFAEFPGNKVFVISTGENKYDKPYEKEMKKLKGKILRTDQLGTIVVESDGEKVRVLNEGI